MVSKSIRLAAIEPGVECIVKGISYRITQVLDLDVVLARRLDTGESQQLKIADIRRSNEGLQDQDILTVPEKDWVVASERYAVIEPLIKNIYRTKSDVAERAKQAGVHIATVYRWIRNYERSGKLSGLLPSKPSGGRGKSRMVDDVEAIIRATIDDTYLTRQKTSIPKTCRTVIARCKAAGLTPPHSNTIRNRIAMLTDRLKTSKREGWKAARNKFEPIKGVFPGADYPLSIVQIDHTPLDLMIVDEKHRQPIGRPWLTLGIDVYSRVVVGFYLSLEKPSAVSVGVCLSHGILPKDAWLADIGVETDWPVWGIPAIIHVDNAKEFKSKMLVRACDEYGIDLHYRPIATPHYGGHIERLLGALNQQVHELPGSTFSNPQKRGRYKSHRKAVFTLREIEYWLTELICNIYHCQLHSMVNQRPLDRYRDGIMGTDESPGRGLTPLPYDAERLRLDFLPFEERTVQPTGLRLHGIYYFADVLRPWVHAREKGSGKKKRKFIVRYDPRDISRVYFFDPELKRYYTIPYRNIQAPAMTLWELREVSRYLKNQGVSQVDEGLIFQAFERLQEIEKTASGKTRSHRRRSARRESAAIRPLKDDCKLSNEPISHGDLSDDKLSPFDEIEV